MLLTLEDARLFFKLYSALMQFVGERIREEGCSDFPGEYSAQPAEQRVALAKVLLGRLDLIEAFLRANPAQLTPEELDIVASWRHQVGGRFIVLRQLRPHMIFLDGNTPVAAYGVTALSEPMGPILGRPLPVMVETVLFPFRGKIVYDGILSQFNVTFGPGSRSGFEANLRSAKARQGIVSSLPWAPPTPKPSLANRQPRAKQAPAAAVSSAQAILKQVVELTDEFCAARLNPEYAALCRKLAEKLAAKRPSPLLRGELGTWAAGIIRTIGWVNFLDSRTQTPHLKMPEIDRAFGIGASTGQGKALAIRKLLKIHNFDHRWTRPSMWESTTMIWMLLNARGLMVDIRKEPLDSQRAAFEQGLIPYVPAERAAAAQTRGSV